MPRQSDAAISRQKAAKGGKSTTTAPTASRRSILTLEEGLAVLQHARLVAAQAALVLVVADHLVLGVRPPQLRGDGGHAAQHHGAVAEVVRPDGEVQAQHARVQAVGVLAVRVLLQVAGLGHLQRKKAESGSESVWVSLSEISHKSWVVGLFSYTGL